MREDWDFEGPFFDHLVHVVPDVRAAADEYGAAGFPAHVAGVEKGVGFRNGSWGTGGSRYVEILQLLDAEEYAVSSIYGPMAPYLLPALRATGQARLIGVRVPDTFAAVERMRAAGIGAEFHRATFERPGGPVSYDLGWPVESPGWLPFVHTLPGDRRWRIQWQRENWPERFPADGVSYDFEALVIETAEPRRNAEWAATVLGLAPPTREGDRWRVALPECHLLLVPGTAERITTVVLDGLSAPTDVLGLRYEPTRAGQGLLENRP